MSIPCHVCLCPDADHRVYERGTVLYVCAPCLERYVRECGGQPSGPAPFMVDWAKTLKDKALEVVT